MILRTQEAKLCFSNIKTAHAHNTSRLYQTLGKLFAQQTAKEQIFHRSQKYTANKKVQALSSRKRNARRNGKRDGRGRKIGERRRKTGRMGRKG